MTHNADKKSAVAQLLQELGATADPSSKAFAEKLKVTSKPETLLGIRIPTLRKYAKKLAKLLPYEEAINLLLPLAEQWNEYKLLFALVLQEVTPLEQVAQVIPTLYSMCDGWAVSDLYNGVLGSFAKRGALQEVLASIERYKTDENPFARRLTIVTFFPLIREELVTPEVALQHISTLEADNHYYVEMANAWLLAELTIRFPQLHHNIESPTLLQKYKQKLRDSYRTARK